MQRICQHRLDSPDSRKGDTGAGAMAASLTLADEVEGR